MTQARAFVDDVMEHVDALYNHARHVTGRDAEAEDLVQETCVRALAAARTFTGGNLKAWLFRMLRNAFIDLRRKRRNEQALGELDVVDGADDVALLRDDRELDRLRGVVGGDLEAALAELSPEARAIILLDVEGFAESEIAAMLECPAGTVKSRLSRARVLLRRRLKDYARTP
ncbi:MAG TPA: RNA polymerase sigma factor [Polyangia bacterium]|nr:RNA polymerase sigma factor [Polyangia bacterium]